MTLRELGFDSDVDVTGLTCDSRAVKPGFVFAALPGTVTDGREYIESALGNGCQPKVWNCLCLIWPVRSRVWLMHKWRQGFMLASLKRSWQ